MNISRKWLKEFVDIQATDREYDEIMTIAGQKVETVTRMDTDIQNVVVGKVLTMQRHENSDHMWVCMVDVGSGAPVQIVTGAQNVHEGDLVPAALDDSLLPGGVHIKAGKLRGVDSNGMLCSFAELGLTQNDVPEAYADGIWILNDEDCAVGQDINEVIGNDDSIVEFEITNNRPDCYSLLGLARETAAAFNVPMRHHEPVVKGGGEGSLPELLDVDVQADDLCLRYSARMVRNVKIAPSPKWMRQRLRSAGIRPINNIVDITNYVMVEYGQPMHAFDYRYVNDGRIVIADEEKPVGLAGIMGGENSEIVADTVDVVFESANFLGASIRKTALALGMRTDASAKFEKDIDPMLTVPAVDRACELVELLGAGEVLDGVIDVINYVPQPVTLPLEEDKINTLLGTDISRADMIDYLRREEIEVKDGLIQVPSWRPDLRCMADIAEEVARYYGYNNIPTTLMRGATTRGGYSEEAQLENAACAMARSLGFDEIITYSFVSPASFDAIGIPADSPLRNAISILNPLGEDTSIMRTVILPSMLDILARNFAHKNRDVKLYELGRIYLPQAGEKLPFENKRLIFGAYGAGETFFKLKGEVDALLHKLNIQPASYEALTDPAAYHPGRCARILIGGKDAGVIGQIHPLVAERYGIGAEVYCAELDFDLLFASQAEEHVFHPLPRFPAVTRDLALVCDEGITIGQLEACIRKAGGALLRKIDLFDIYRGTGIAEGKKSVAFSLELRADDRTLTDDDSTGTVQRILDALQKELGAVLR